MSSQTNNDITLDDLGAVFVFDEPIPTSTLSIALFSVRLALGPDVDAALQLLGIGSSRLSEESHSFVPRYIFGVAYAGGRDYLEVSALEFDEGTYICGIERGPHYEAYSDEVLKAIGQKLYIREAKGSVDGHPCTLLPPAEPSFGDEDDDDFDEDETRPREVELTLSPENHERVMFVQDAWRQAIDYFPEYMYGIEKYRRATLRQPVKDLKQFMTPFENSKSNLLWLKNWSVANFAELNSDWEAFSYLRKRQ